MIGQGRIQDFSQGGARYKIYVYTARSAVPYSREERKFLGGSPPPELVSPSHKHNYG